MVVADVPEGLEESPHATRNRDRTKGIVALLMPTVESQFAEK
jgi:hypothetical protein